MKRRDLFKALLGIIAAPAVFAADRTIHMNLSKFTPEGFESLICSNRFRSQMRQLAAEAYAEAYTARIPYIGPELLPAEAAKAFAEVSKGFVYHLHF
jgi:hypothetical protein